MSESRKKNNNFRWINNNERRNKRCELLSSFYPHPVPIVLSCFYFPLVYTGGNYIYSLCSSLPKTSLSWNQLVSRTVYFFLFSSTSFVFVSTLKFNAIRMLIKLPWKNRLCFTGLGFFSGAYLWGIKSIPTFLLINSLLLNLLNRNRAKTMPFWVYHALIRRRLFPSQESFKLSIYSIVNLYGINHRLIERRNNAL